MLFCFHVFFFSLALSILGGLPVLVVFIMTGVDHISVKRMMYKSRKREQKVRDAMEILGSGNKREQTKVLQSVDLTTEYFHGRYHRATLFDIAAHSGTETFW